MTQSSAPPWSASIGSPGPLVWVVFPLYLVAILATAVIVFAKRDAAAS